MINAELYMRRGHYYLETSRGRKEVFAYLRAALERALRERRERELLRVLVELEGLLSGNSLLLNNPDLPNFHFLKSQKGAVRREALEFLRENLQAFYEGAAATRGVYTRRWGLYLLARYLPEIPYLPAEEYLGLIFLLVTTAYAREEFSGALEEKEALEDLAARGLARYDLFPLALQFPGFSREFRQKLKKFEKELDPYRGFLQALARQRGEVPARVPLPAEVFLPAILTRWGWVALKEERKTELKETHEKEPTYFRKIQEFLRKKLGWTTKVSFPEKDLFFKEADRLIEERWEALKDQGPSFKEVLEIKPFSPAGRVS